MPSWPATLPPFEENAASSPWQETDRQLFIEQQTDGGEPKRRVDPNPLPGRAIFGQFMTQAQTLLLDTFYETTLASGTLPFDTTHPRKGVSKSFKFRTRPTVQFVGGSLWIVSYDLLILT